VQSLLTEKYLDGLLNNPQISVRVAAHKSQQVEIYGAVKSPGPYYLSGPTTLLEMIGRAGWINADKSSNHVLLIRPGAEPLALSINAVMEGDSNIPVRGGDVISVEEGKVVYVGGEVETAGPVAYFEGLTVMQALLKAGGPNETARLRGAYVMRDGEKIPVNIKRIIEGRDADVSLRSGDQLYLKESPI
jgi:polysaccharide export outer membrane protein